MQPAQANFYLSPDYIDRAGIGMGLGRYETVMEGREAVDSEEDMRVLSTRSDTSSQTIRTPASLIRFQS